MLLTTQALLLTTLSAPANLAPEPVEPWLAQQKKSVPADADPRLSWSFAEVHVLLRDVDAVDDHLRGFGARGAWEFDQGFFLRGGIDFYSDDQDLTRYDLGFGQSVPLEAGLKAYASISWVHLELDGAGGGNFDEDGWRAELGARTLLDERVELEARLGWQDVGDDGFLFGGDLRYWFLPNVSLGLGFEREVDDDVWTLGLRYGF